jgi:hypothetical protein
MLDRLTHCKCNEVAAFLFGEVPNENNIVACQETDFRNLKGQCKGEVPRDGVLKVITHHLFGEGLEVALENLVLAPRHIAASS